MPGWAKSMDEKAIINKREHDALMASAVAAYLVELDKPDFRTCHGLRTIFTMTRRVSLYILVIPPYLDWQMAVTHINRPMTTDAGSHLLRNLLSSICN
jgi:hypothetical protein